MAITYPLTVPNYTSFRSVSLIARNTVGVSTSPYTAQQKIYQWRGQFWEVDIVLKLIILISLYWPHGPMGPIGP